MVPIIVGVHERSLKWAVSLFAFADNKTLNVFNILDFRPQLRPRGLYFILRGQKTILCAMKDNLHYFSGYKLFLYRATTKSVYWIKNETVTELRSSL